MPRNPSRPLSPHLTIWKWGPHMLVSILHRITGAGLATVGAAALVWWLVAAATSAEAYADFVEVATSWFGILVGVGLTWALFQHTLSGIRHFVLDMGAGYELSTNKRWALVTLGLSLALTIAFWLLIVGID
ncbi:MAG TPA: succinate dehydrogenase, cytochrome b556 subunit [Allosphingosinicella sp.]|uniref:succinate dehydrogenase, cytochrome b556 subunit n=1 Tax=Allosphingosinicella sp. TaxID=2823234 RepID=UPI002ED9788E